MRNLYGTTPYINLEKWMVRTRISNPVTFDFPKLADQVRRTNVRTLEVRLEAEAEIRDGKVVLHPTGQSFPLEGGPPADTGRALRRMKVLSWDTDAPRLELTP